MNTSSTQSAPNAGQPGGATSSSDFGRIDEAGTIWVKDGDGERVVGAYPEELPEDPFALYVRRYLDLEATINLFRTRLPVLSAKDIDQTLVALQEQVKEPKAIGDLAALRDAVEQLVGAAAIRKEELKAERAAAKTAALEARTAVVEQAEAVAGQDPARIQWKNSGQQLRDLLDEWKSLQRRGPRLDKATEDALWRRFSAARTKFDRGRRQFFAELDASQKDARAQKEALIEQATALQASEEWGPTSAAYRRLMDEWKLAGRASRKVDDGLWARFRAAQQVFFDRRRAHDEAQSAEVAGIVTAKEQLLKEAEGLLPIKDLKEAKRLLREIQDRWEEVGQLSGRERGALEARLRAVENEVRGAEDAEWRRTNPETKARGRSMLDQLEQSIAELQARYDAAVSAGNDQVAAETKDALDTKRAWLDQVRGSLS